MIDIVVIKQNMIDPTRTIPKRRYPLWGVCLHTTGSGVPTKARKLKKDPAMVAVDYYHNATRVQDGKKVRWGGPVWLIAYDRLIQVANEDDRTEHVGSFGPKGEDRRAQYMSGEWEKLLAAAGKAEAVVQWKKAWPNRKHPWLLFPHRHPNDDFQGVEMIPLIGGETFERAYLGNGDLNYMAPGLRFTKFQHDCAAALVKYVAAHNNWPKDWLAKQPSRLVGHEDVGLLDRSDKFGGWDAGFLRAKPYFDMNYVRAEVAK